MYCDGCSRHQGWYVALQLLSPSTPGLLNNNVRPFGWCISFPTITSNCSAVSTSFCPTRCFRMSPAVCGGWPHWVLVFMQVLQLDLCNSCPHGHTADWLTRLENFFSLFTLASRVWVLLRAIVEALNFSHSESCGDPYQFGHTNTHSSSFPPKHTRTHRLRGAPVHTHTST